MNWIKKIFGDSRTKATAPVNFQKGADAYEAGDYATALAVLTPLVEVGNAEAQYYLGRMYADGFGVAKDEVEAVRLYSLAAEAGHTPAQNNLGVMYSEGRGVPQDKTEAVKLYRTAAEAGNFVAQYNLGFAYECGSGIAKDEEEAVKWYTLVAEAGHDFAQSHLGLMHLYGRGVPENKRLAYKWYGLAASQGYEMAVGECNLAASFMDSTEVAETQYGLGLKHKDNMGVPRIPQDYRLAYMWFYLAADLGNEKASEECDKLTENMTSEQIVEAKEMAQKYKKRY